MAQSVIPKKEEKVNSVFSAMENIDDLAEFKKKFKEMYPADLLMCDKEVIEV